MPEARNEDHSINRNWLGGIIMVLSPRNIYICVHLIYIIICLYTVTTSRIFIYLYTSVSKTCYTYLLIKYLFARAFNQHWDHSMRNFSILVDHKFWILPHETRLAKKLSSTGSSSTSLDMACYFGLFPTKKEVSPQVEARVHPKTEPMRPSQILWLATSTRGNQEVEITYDKIK